MVADYAEGLPTAHRAIILKLHNLMGRGAPNAVVSVKWNNLCYVDGGLLTYINASRKHVAFGFFQGVDLADPLELLEGSGKSLRQIRLQTVADIQAAMFLVFIKQAVRLNRKTV